MFATFSASFAIGAIFSPSYFCSASLDATMDAGWGYDIPYNFAATLDAEMDGDALATPSYNMDTELDMEATLSAAWIVQYDMAAALDATMLMRYAIFPKYSMSATLDAEMTGYIAIMINWGTAYQTLTALFTMIPIRTVSQIFNIEIPPGGRLVIDSDNYTVYLNNENAIHTYSGDWIKINRAFQSIEVDSGTSGDVDVSVLYRERFL